MVKKWWNIKKDAAEKEQEYSHKEQEGKRDKKQGTRRLVPIESILEYIKSSIKYLTEIKNELADKSAKQELDGIIQVLDDTLKGHSWDRKAEVTQDERWRAELWLGVSRNEIVSNVIVGQGFSADFKSKLLSNIRYELEAPLRELYSTLIEQGGRELDDMVSKDPAGIELEREIDEIRSNENLTRQEQDIEIIKHVQSMVGRYFDKSLYSSSDTLSKQLMSEAMGYGIPANLANLFAQYREIKPVDIGTTKHMTCVMMSYLCGRILREHEFTVYWINVQENYLGQQEDHVAIIARLRGGTYYLVDAAQPKGSGWLGNYIEQGEFLDEIENALKDKFVYFKELDETRDDLHHRVRILRFEGGVASSIWNNIGVIYHAKGDSDEAIACYHNALQTNPKDAVVWRNLSALYANNGNLDKARQCYNEALKINPKIQMR